MQQPPPFTLQMELGKCMEQKNLRNGYIRVIGGLLIKVNGKMGIM